MMTKEEYQNCKFHDPHGTGFVPGRGHISHTMKIHYFFKNLYTNFLYSRAKISQTKYIHVVMIPRKDLPISLISWPRNRCLVGEKDKFLQKFFSLQLSTEQEN